MNKKKNINFLGIRKYTIIASFFISIISITSIFYCKLNFGLEFTGGTLIHLSLDKPEKAKIIKEKLRQNKILNADIKFSNQNENEITVRIPNANRNQLSNLKKTIHEIFENNVTIKKIEFIGSEVGNELIEKSIIAVIISVLSTIVYISLRFEIKFAVSAAISLIYVIFFILGILSFFQIQFNLTTLASLLAVMGYSLNDTIVVFDRIRENLDKLKNTSLSIVNLINISINQTLSRTLLTSFFTMLVILSLMFKGGENLYSFSIVFFLGILIGTYSSIYVASSFAIYLGIKVKK